MAKLRDINQSLAVDRFDDEVEAYLEAKQDFVTAFKARLNELQNGEFKKPVRC